MRTQLDRLIEKFPLPWQVQRDDTVIDRYGDDAEEWDILDANGRYTYLTTTDEDVALSFVDLINVLGSETDGTNDKLKDAQLEYILGQMES